VIIGPVTQFNGPVTIYQNVNGQPTTPNQIENGSVNNSINGKLVKSESTSSDAPHPVEKSSKNSLCNCKYMKYLIIPILVIVILVIVGLVILLGNSKDTPPPKSNDNLTIRPISEGMIIEKSKWGGREARNNTEPLPHPAQFVIIAHTVTPMCYDFPACSKRVQSIQNYHIGSKNYADIGYNFVVGGDGNVYVGRGWDLKNVQNIDSSISISFIGDFTRDYLTPSMINVTKKLLEDGVEKNKLARDYKLVCHSQTQRTISPGPHVCQVVQTWPHFDPGIYFPR
jgi:hypothetical protein